MKKNVTKSSLLMSVLAIVITVSMLIGTTFAWFTDSVVSANNVITSGNLDVEFEYWNGSAWVDVSGKSDIIDNILWEPGAADVAYFRVTNAGSLALKYQLGVNVVSETEGVNQVGKTFKLSDHIMFGMVNDVNGETNAFATSKDAIFAVNDEKALSEGRTDFSSLLPTKETYFALVVYMPTTVNNIANHNGVNVPVINLGIECLATQDTQEYDSFDNQYDKDAVYPVNGNVIDNGECGDVEWDLTDTGILAVVPDSNSGSWKEAVIYDENGKPVDIADPLDSEAYEDVTTLVIEDGVTSIGSFSAKFPNLTGEVVIPASVTYIGQEAFQNAPITKLTFAPGGTEKLCIAPGAFKNLAIEELVLPDDRPVEIHCWAFQNCKQLKKVTLPANVTTFSNWTHVDYCGMDYVEGSYRYSSDIFAYCSALETITFGSEEVKTKFLAAQGNSATVNKYGVTLEVK